jgi:hypothetical protein
MAEETPVDGTTKENLDNITGSANDAKDAFSFLGVMTESVKNQLSAFNDKVTSLKNNFDDNQRTLDNQTNAFGLLSVAILGVRKSFDNLNGIDTSQLSTFSDQIKDIQDVITKDSSLDTMAKKSVALAQALGLPTEMAKQGFGAILNYANNLATSADNALRLQNAYIQLSAKTGSLNDVYSAAGPNLSNINALLEKQDKLISSSVIATGVAPEAVRQYYSQLGAIPQALNSVVTGADGAGSSVSLLTATMQLASGSGRKYSEIVDDLRSAFRDYNITGDEALKFTARMGELSGKFGVELSDVRDALRSTASNFAMFGNEAEGAAGMMNQYLGALKATGVSGTVAVGIVQNMTGGIKDLTLAQKGFLSAQTGGPGGLMGAFQIEKELREGKIDKVFDRVRQTMSKQFGNIVSLEEASQSQSAAAQLTKQVMMLRQGPLGQFAKSDQEAIRILESFKATNSGKAVTPLSETVTSDVQAAGVDVNKKSYTELTRIRSLIESARGTANIANLGFMQDSFAAGTGQLNPEVDTASGMRDNINQTMKLAGKQGATAAEGTAGALAGEQLINKAGQSVHETANNIRDFTNQFGESMRAPIDNAKRLMNQNKSNELAAEASKKQYNESMAAGGLVATASEGAISEPTNIAEAISSTSAGQLGGVAIQAANIVKKTKPTDVSMPGQTITANSQQELNGQITVHVEGFCLDCGDKIKGSNQSFSVNTAQKAKK